MSKMTLKIHLALQILVQLCVIFSSRCIQPCFVCLVPKISTADSIQGNAIHQQSAAAKKLQIMVKMGFLFQVFPWYERRSL